MNKHSTLILVFACLSSLLYLSGCSSPTYSDYEYSRDYQRIQRLEYSNYYHLAPLLLAASKSSNKENDKNTGLELVLITELKRQDLPGKLTLKALTGHVDGRDYMVNAKTILLLNNKNDFSTHFALKAVSLGPYRLPLSRQDFNLNSKEQQQWELGEVLVDMRQIQLPTRIEYVLDGQHIETNHKQKRLTQKQVRQELRGIQIPNSL